MKPIPLPIAFALALFVALFGSVFLPHIRLMAFAPFLALLYMREELVASLWIATACGLCVDLFSSELRFGTHALIYCLTTFFLYSQKRNFFSDQPLAFSLFTALISCFSTLLQLTLLYLFGTKFPFSVALLCTDGILMPFLDALYAFLWFTCPMKLVEHFLLKYRSVSE